MVKLRNAGRIHLRFYVIGSLVFQTFECKIILECPFCDDTLKRFHVITLFILLVAMVSIERIRVITCFGMIVRQVVQPFFSKQMLYVLQIFLDEWSKLIMLPDRRGESILCCDYNRQLCLLFLSVQQPKAHFFLRETCEWKKIDVLSDFSNPLGGAKTMFSYNNKIFLKGSNFSHLQRESLYTCHDFCR